MTYLPKVHNGMKNSTKIRSDLNIMQHGRRFLSGIGILFLCVKKCEPKTIDSASAMVGGLTYGANYVAEMSAVEFYESGIDVIVQSSCIVFGNFYHSWVSVLMDHHGPWLWFCHHLHLENAGYLAHKKMCWFQQELEPSLSEKWSTRHLGW